MLQWDIAEIAIKEYKLIKNKISWCYAKFREVCEIGVLEVNSQWVGCMLEKTGKIDIETDESLFMKRKYKKIHVENVRWVCALIKRGSSIICLVPVEYKNAGIIICTINDVEMPGSRIISDE